MKNKKLGIALLTLAVFTTARTEDKELYQPKTPWPFAPFEDAAVGATSTAAEIVTVGHADTGNAPTGLVVAIPDAVPGVSAARADKTNSRKSPSKAKSKKTRQTESEDAQ